MGEEKLTEDKIRKTIWDLSARRDRIQRKLSYPPPMIEGCLQTVYKKCGSPNCRCAKGNLHGPYWVLSKKAGKKRKLTYLEKALEAEKVGNYQKYNRDLAAIRKINEKIFYWLRCLRDKNTITYEKK